MLVVGFDLETTGLSIKEDRVTEIGAVLWDTQLSAPISIFSALIRIDGQVSELITNLTGIHQWMLDKYGKSDGPTFHEFSQFMSQGEALIAHNGKNFDIPFLKEEFHRHDVTWPEDLIHIDTSVDVPYPDKIEIRKLSYLACEHGFLNPFPHRAVTDVLTMLQIMSKYDFPTILKLSGEADVTLRALVSFQNKDLAKNTGYRFRSEDKLWIKRIKESQVGTEEERAKAAGFSVVVL